MIMKKLNYNLWHLCLTLPCMLLATGCEKDTESNEPVELQIAPTVAVTRSVIEGGEQTANKNTIMQNVAVYATGDDYTKAKSNNHAIYLLSSGSWSSTGSDLIYLTNKTATIYAYYPAYKSDGTTFQPISEDDVTANSTIPISVLESSAAITVADNATGDAIAAADGEIDYMYATSATASNQNASKSITLTMKHALSMVSFRVYKSSDYHGTGDLTQIVLKNTNGSSVLSKGSTSTTMNVTTGTITQNTATAATYTRTIATGTYTLGTVESEAKKLSILVLPITDSAIQDGKIEAVFTIDGATYTAAIKAPTETGTEGKWKPGNNNLYTVKLSGTALEVTKVEVTAWSEVAGGNLDIQ